jgi:hypothetical protein
MPFYKDLFFDHQHSKWSTFCVPANLDFQKNHLNSQKSRHILTMSLKLKAGLALENGNGIIASEKEIPE